MSRSGLRVESGNHMGVKLGAVGASALLQGASDYTVNPSRAAVDFLRSLGREPFDVFNHTGDMTIGAIAGMFGSYAVTGAQVMISRLCGTTETASPTRMNYIRTAAGILAAAAATYAFEKITGSFDPLDVLYSLPSGAATSSLIQVERVEPAEEMQMPSEEVGHVPDVQLGGQQAPPSELIELLDPEACQPSVIMSS